jgi:hypothetical protein
VGVERKIEKKMDHEQNWKKGSLAQRMETQESSV